MTGGFLCITVKSWLAVDFFGMQPQTGGLLYGPSGRIVAGGLGDRTNQDYDLILSRTRISLVLACVEEKL
jgi:hypothetical protein